MPEKEDIWRRRTGYRPVKSSP